MFLFYHTDQNDSNKSYYKGILFEQLLKKYLEYLGYCVDVRIKNNSLEYDINGIAKLTEQKIIGEAKAYDKNISTPIITSFVGKLLPLGLIEKHISGLFLSTSPLTPEAENYFRSIENLGVKSITSKKLFDSIIKELNMPNIENLSNSLSDKGYEVQAKYLLTTNRGYFVGIVTGTKDTVTPSYIAFFNSKGELINDEKFLLRIIENTSEIASLKPIIENTYLEKTGDQRILSSGLIVGSNWIDYRLPAGPNYFIGRNLLINEVINSIMQGVDTNIIQVKSRSGVGKSSILALIEKKLSEQGIHTELHDSRDIKSVLDLKTIVRRFVRSDSTPQDMREVEDLISEFAINLKTNKAVFIVDQFESTFIKPEIFNSYETIANIFLKYKNNLFFCLARKNDQLTTYDESKISLERLNEISKPYTLQDFTKEEAMELISKINAGLSVPIGNDILSYVLEFAQGFPWLLKRTMAHIMKLVIKMKVAQNELFAIGLKLDDLFEEELEGLDEIEKEYLYKIANKLPSDFHQLHRYFDEDPTVPRILDKLTQSRLLRMTGATYDTYNDVFKEYLIYRKLPEFRQSIIYRAFPYSVMTSFFSVIEQSSFTFDQLEEYLQLGKGSIFNNIREWRNFGLIEKNGELWSIPKNIIDAYNRRSLGDFIRRKILDNDIVVKLIGNISNKTKRFKAESLSEFIKEQFPFVDATEQTWQQYSNILKAWLLNLKIIEISEDDHLILNKTEREKIICSLGNLENMKSTKRSIQDIFLPSVSWNTVEDCILDIINGIIPEGDEKIKALRDLKNLGIYENNTLTIKEIAEVKNLIREILLTEPYTILWSAVREKKKLLPIFHEIVTTDWSEQTNNWRIKKLVNWAKAFGIIENRRYTPHKDSLNINKEQYKLF